MTSAFAKIAVAAFDDELTKTAIIGPAYDLALLGTPSIGYYNVAKDLGRSKAGVGDPRPKRGVGSYAALALLPGAIGYQAGIRSGWDEKKKEMLQATKKKKK